MNVKLSLYQKNKLCALSHNMLFKSKRVHWRISAACSYISLIDMVLSSFSKRKACSGAFLNISAVCDCGMQMDAPNERIKPCFHNSSAMVLFVLNP